MARGFARAAGKPFIPIRLLFPKRWFAETRTSGLDMASETACENGIARYGDIIPMFAADNTPAIFKRARSGDDVFACGSVE